MARFAGALSVFLLVLFLAIGSGWTPPTLNAMLPAPTPIVIVQGAAPTPVWATRVKVIDRAAVVHSIRSQSFLATTRYQGAATVKIKREGVFFDLIGGETVKLIAVGTVHSGVDLSQLRASNIKISSTNEMTITVDAPSILSVALDADQTYVSDNTLTWFAASDPALADAARREATRQIRQIACENDLEQQTAEDVKSAVADLVRTFNAASVTVVVPPSDMCER